MKPKLKAIGQRLREARLNVELTQADVARRIGKSKQIASAWETGRVDIPATTLCKLAGIVGADLNWLLHGITPGGGLDVGVPNGTYIPKRDPQALIKRPAGDAKEAGASGSVHSCFPVGPDAFALDVMDAAMSPEFATGDVIIIDPAVAVRPGAIAAAIVRDAKRRRSLVLRRVQFRSMQLGSAPYDLCATNPDWPSFTIADERAATLLGTVIAVFRRFA